MNTALLTEIEQRIAQLTPDEQRVLLQRLRHTVRQSRDIDHVDIRREMEEMARDPDIQRELRAINAKFGVLRRIW